MKKIDTAPLIQRTLTKFDAAKHAVNPPSVYGRRLALFEEGLSGIKEHYERIKDGRVDVPTYSFTPESEDMEDIVTDGKLDESFWDDLPGSLKQLQTGNDVLYPTKFKR